MATMSKFSYLKDQSESKKKKTIHDLPPTAEFLLTKRSQQWRNFAQEIWL